MPPPAALPDEAAALTAAQQFAAALLAIEEARADDAPADPAPLAALASRGGLTVRVGYESDDGEACPGACTCDVQVAVPERGVDDAAACLAHNSIGFSPSEDQWLAWSAEEMESWTWQIDASPLAGLAERARLVVLHAPETLYVFAVVTDDDGAARVSAVYSGMTYDE